MGTLPDDASAARAWPAGHVIRGLGIFHESYAVPAGSYEAIYINTPPTGLSRVGKVVSAAHGRMRTAKGRLGQSDGSDHADVEGYAAPQAE